MKKYISLLFAILMMAFTVNAFAFTPPPKPDNGWYIVDQANKLSEDQKTSLNKKIDNLNKTTKNEFGVLILSSLNGEDIEDVAHYTLRSWGIGKVGLNNGVLLVISVGDRKSRLQTGKGAEGDLPDLRAKDILDNNLKPFLKKGDFYGGINSTLDATSSFMESRSATPVPEKTEQNSAPVTVTTSTSSNSSDGSGFIVFLVLLFGMISFIGIVAVVSSRSRKRQQEEEERLVSQREYYRKQEELARQEQARRTKRELEAAALRAKASELVNNIQPNPSVSHYAAAIPAAKRTSVSSTAIAGAAAAAVGTAAIVAAREEEAKKRKKKAEAEAREAEAAARKRREEQEESDRKRREESYSSSSYSSSSSYDSGSSSSSWDSGGGGFGGGDSGGGGASSDW